MVNVANLQYISQFNLITTNQGLYSSEMIQLYNSFGGITETIIRFCFIV